ncbi:hypothetical protein GCM10010129_25090 [Streptomyces fumigatiscleroticus]|nr:hypothetical protein GCM10010129_25090 [Streptomyces fumigatiscleroticus]
MKSVLSVLTGHGELGAGGRPTGFHLGETAEPWRILRDAGHRVDFVSVRGGRPPMTGYDAGCPAHDAFLEDPAGGLLLDRAPVPEEADPDDYDAVYFVGGHGTMWDFRGHPALERLARRIHEAGGVVAAICHGPAALVDVRLADGRHLVAGRRLTCFADAHDRARGLDGLLPFPLQRTLQRRGAVLSHAPDRKPHVVVDGRLVTGQNPQSARELGERLVRLLAAAPVRPPRAGTARFPVSTPRRKRIMPKKVLFALTSHGELGGTGRSTGFYVPEVAHPAAVFRAAGYDIDFVSVRGGAPPQDGVDPDDEVVAAFLADPAVKAALESTRTAAEVSAEDYDVLFYAGGHGAMWDFPGDSALAALASAVYERGGVVAAVCHGPAGLVDIRLSDGSHLVDGKRVACFTNEEEAAVGLSDVVPFLLESKLVERGARHTGTAAFAEHAVADRRLVTGQNPASAVRVAELALAELGAA